MLLVPQDLPPEWTPVPDSTRQFDPGTVTICGSRIRTPPKAVAQATAVYTYGATRFDLVHTATEYSGHASEQVVSAVDTLARSCSEWTAGDESGNRVTYRVARLAAPALGDATLIVRVTTVHPLAGGETLDLVLVAKGHILSLLAVATSAFASIEVGDIDHLARILAGKITG